MLKYGEYWEKDLYYVTEEQAKKWTVGWREHPVDPSSDPGILYGSQSELVCANGVAGKKR